MRASLVHAKSPNYIILQAESVGLTIAGVNVEAVDCVRDLGVYLDVLTSVALCRHVTFTYDGCAIYVTWSVRRSDSVLFQH